MTKFAIESPIKRRELLDWSSSGLTEMTLSVSWLCHVLSCSPPLPQLLFEQKQLSSDRFFGIVMSDPSSSKIAKRFLKRYLILIAVCVIGIALAVHRFLVVSRYGLGFDNTSFLVNGAVFSGFYKHGYDASRPPFIPLLLALGFLVTSPAAVNGMLLSGAFYVVGVFGAYLLAETVMNRVFAILTSVSFNTITSVVYWVGTGFSDVEGVAIASLGLGLLVYATRKRPNLYLLAIPVVFIAFFTRYTMGVAMLSSVVFLAFESRTSNLHVGKIVGGAALALGISAIVSYDWLALAGYNFKSLFPGGHTVSGTLAQPFYILSLPMEIGYGTYGLLLAALFAIACVLIIYDSIRHKTDPVIVALLAWIFPLLLYYSLYQINPPGGTSDLLRYSTEFALPVVILAFWSFHRLVSHLFVSRKWLAIGGVCLIALILLPTATPSFIHGWNITNAPGNSLATTNAMRDAAGWLNQNASTNTILGCNWWPACAWFAPQFRSIFIESFSQTNQTFAGQVTALIHHRVGYVVWSSSSKITYKNSHLQLVWISSQKKAFIYKMTP